LHPPEFPELRFFVNAYIIGKKGCQKWSLVRSPPDGILISFLCCFEIDTGTENVPAVEKRGVSGIQCFK